MADDSKSAGTPDIGPVETILGIIIIVVIGSYIQSELYGDGSSGFVLSDLWSGFFDLNSFVLYLKFAGVVLTVLAFAGIVYLIKRLGEVRKAESEMLKLRPEKSAEEGGSKPAGDRSWERIMEHISSEGESDWKLAILEADIMLSNMLTAMGYRGDSIGEQLKQIEKSDFLTLDNAWEAHKIRNRIAHEGQSYAMSQHEARRVIELYRSVFEEFHYI